MLRKLYSMSELSDKRRILVVEVIKGMVEAKISTAMMQDANGSKPLQPVQRTSNVDKTTDSEPRASAIMWR